MNITIKIADKDNNILKQKTSQDEIYLVYDKEYSPGDRIILESDQYNVFMNIKLDDTMPQAFIYLTQAYTLDIPFDKDALSYNPKSFRGTRHYIYAGTASKEDMSICRNIALNPYDHHDNKGAWPHSYANVETRGESVFASRNAIDGLLADDMHGEWPYSSWGINQNPMAEFHLDFGHKVKAESISIYLRADFPHDGCWKTGLITFDDGTTLNLDFEERGGKQEFVMANYFGSPKEFTSLKLDHLVKYDDHSPFPALTQIQVHGIYM